MADGRHRRNLRAAYPSDIKTSGDGAELTFVNGTTTNRDEEFVIHLDWYYIAELGQLLQKAKANLRKLQEQRMAFIDQSIKDADNG